jgi:hypothetical protein
MRGIRWRRPRGAAAVQPRARVLRERARLYTQYFTLARTLVRWTDESAKPNGQRLPEYSDARKAAIERQMASEAPIYPGWNRRSSSVAGVMEQQLGADNAAGEAILAGKTPKARRRSSSPARRWAIRATRKALARRRQGGDRGVEGSVHRAGALVDARARELRTKYDNEVLAVERDAYAKIAQAVFATQGDAAYPDGTFTLRLSYGQVKGYMENGKPVTPFTEIRGLYVRGDEHKQKPPYKIADSWMKGARRRSTRPPPTTSSAPTTSSGGNSGSPVINVEGVSWSGLIFDGNIQSLPGYFVYDAAVNRAVSVECRGMLEAIRVVYKGDGVGGRSSRVSGRQQRQNDVATP